MYAICTTTSKRVSTAFISGWQVSYFSVTDACASDRRQERFDSAGIKRYLKITGVEKATTNYKLSDNYKIVGQEELYCSTVAPIGETPMALFLIWM